jgi:hypothetical protein
MEPSQALGVMEEANTIIQNFSTGKYALYLAIFSLQIALCFLVAAMM